ncbi:unnamed protein product [Durusdinium trenchii]|uniref:Uncharacterized protein n=2 Tax=Durusdinium trenchii TaxID=1381693 RepID=A0ABP0MN75_9DINO
MTELRPGAALAAALHQTAKEMAEERSGDRYTARSGVAAEVRRLEQQMEMERRQVERRIERLERRIEEVASANASSGRWAELQGHVDGLAESLQNLIRGRAVDLVDQASAAEEGIKDFPGFKDLQLQADTCSAQLADLDSKVLQMSGRLVQVEYRLEGRDLAAPDRGVPVPGVQADEAGQVDFLRESEDFKDEDMSILEDQVSDMGRRFEQMQRHLEELVTDQSMQNLGERTQRLYSKASAEWSEMTLGKELSAVSEDLTRLWIRVEEHEQSLMPLAEAFRHQEQRRKASTPTRVTQPKAGL